MEGECLQNRYFRFVNSKIEETQFIFRAKEIRENTDFKRESYAKEDI